MQDNQYKSILNKAPFGYAYHRILLDDKGLPIDYEFLEVNYAFEKITGLKADKIIGKTVCEVFPSIREGNFDWVAQYGSVALEGSEFEIEQFSEPLKKWFKVQASSPAKGFFTTLFTDISSQYTLAGITQTFLTYSPETVDYQYIIDTACKISGASYGTLNVFDEDGRSFTTLAFSGMSPFVLKVANQLGFKITGTKWNFDPVREARIEHQKTTFFNSLSELANNSLAPGLIDTITGTLNIGKFVIVKSEKQGRMLGDFTLIFTKNEKLQNQAFLELFADITGLLIDRISHEREVARERAKLEQITAQLTDIVWRTDLQLNSTFVSASVSRMLGFSVKEYMLLPVEMRYKPGQILQFQELLGEELLIDSKPGNDPHRTRTIEIEQFKADGSSVPLEINMSFVRDAKGNPIGLQGISRDISERKLLEKELKHQTRLRELLMQISSEFINVPLEKVDETILHSLQVLGDFVDADRSYTFEYVWNSNICNNMHEWCREGIEPQINELQAVPLDMMPDWVEAHQRGAAMLIPDVHALPPGFAREILEPQGIKSVVSVPMMDNETCIGFVGFDFVRQHQQFSDTELELLKIFAQMVVNVVSRKETMRQLVIAKNRAQESDRLKTAFLANISHEIRTPMNGIIGFINLLRQPNLNDVDRTGYINFVNQSSERLLTTINDIIEVSQIEAGDFKIEKQPVYLDLFFSYYYGYYYPLSRDKQLTFKPIELNTDRNYIVTDSAKLDSIVTNLIKNAVKFTDAGSIEVGCTQQGEGDFYFYVADTGKGIRAEKLDRIFRSFEQEDGSSTRSHEGSGLGLTIAKAYVTALGGKIGVESEPGKGSKFYFTLPAGN